MPRVISKSKNTAGDRTPESGGRKANSKAWKKIVQFASSREARMICGVLMLLFAIIAVLAYLSFLFTGNADQSIIEQSRSAQWENRGEVHNLLGLPGAAILSFDGGPIHPCAYEETDSYQVTAMFINNREQILRRLFDDE